MNRPELCGIDSERWFRVLDRVYLRVSENPQCAPVLKDIGRLRFQLLLTDRPELSYWEEFRGDRVVPHRGTTCDPTVRAATTLPILLGTMLRDVSIMEAAADECYELA